MDYLSLFGIAVGLAMDAFAVSLTNGAVTRGLTKGHALRIAFCFGFFQFMMPIIGWLIGKAGEEFIGAVDHWIAFVLLGYIGGKMIYDSIKEKKSSEKEQCRDPISFKMLIVMAIATSIDALATGIILPTAVKADGFGLMMLSVGMIGVITFFICLCGIAIGKKFGTVFSSIAEKLGGMVLILIGTKILIEHLFFS